MKKFLIFLLVFAFLFTFTAAPKDVNASVSIPEPRNEIWEWYGEGVTGQEIPMDTITTTPREWLQLKANGLKLDGASRICHGFDAGRYGWTGEIFRLVEGTWVKLPTTNGWIPDEEGSYMACAMAPAAGTYALFGYFDKANAPVVEKVLPVCVEGRDIFGSGYTFMPSITYLDFGFWFTSGVAGIPVFVEVIPITGSFSGLLSGTFFSDKNGFVDAKNTVIVSSTGTYEFKVRFTTPTCYFDIDINGAFAY